ncbi:MAG: hypothetical protein NC184_08045, partial [Roseburia sp.]|nr:hypothetical protein [Roseburia sp.]
MKKKRTWLITTILLIVVMAFAAVGCGGGVQTQPELPPKYSVSVTGGTGAGSYYEGQVCTVKAETPNGQQFLKWIKNGQEVSSNEEFGFNVTEDTRLIAVFGEMPENAGKEVCIIKVEGGMGAGGYIKGGKATVTTLAEDEGRAFDGWFAVTADGLSDEPLSTEKIYTFDVTADIVLTAKYSNKLLKVPDNSQNGMFNLIAGNGHIDFDNQMDPVTGEYFTAFTEGVDHILIWVYTSNADDAEPIGAFKLWSHVRSNGMPFGYIGASTCTETIDENGTITVSGGSYIEL